MLKDDNQNSGAFFAFLKKAKNRAIRSYENASVFIPLLSLALAKTAYVCDESHEMLKITAGLQCPGFALRANSESSTRLRVEPHKRL
jgi:hypothetical protein